MAGGRVGGARGQEGRREQELVGGVGGVIGRAREEGRRERSGRGEAGGVARAGRQGAGRARGRVGEGVGRLLGLAVDDLGEGGRVQPGGRDDVGAALLLEQEGEPEREVGAVRGAKGRGLALRVGSRWSVFFFFFFRM